MKKRTKKILAWVGGIIGALLIAAVIWGYFYVYKPNRLLEAMINNDQAEVIRLIDEEGYDPNMKFLGIVDIFTLYAVLPSPDIPINLDMIEILRQKGVNFNNYPRDKNNNLNRAILFRNHMMLEYMLQHGISPNITLSFNGDEISPIEFALLVENYQAIDILLKYNPSKEEKMLEKAYYRALLCVQKKLCSPLLLDILPDEVSLSN